MEDLAPRSKLPARAAGSTLVLVRWGAAAGQAATVSLAALFGVRLPLFALFGLAGLTALSNLVAAAWVRRGHALSAAAGAGLLALDTLVLTASLALAGGAHNPFSVIYLVSIALGALVLGSRWTWGLAALSVLCYGLLFRFYVPLVAVTPHQHGAAAAPSQGSAYELHLKGMWLAFTLAAVLVAHFGARLSQALERERDQVALLRERAARQERLASLATLAAGAAHELGTPLGTIAVAAHEMELAALELPEGSTLIDDARLIRSELQRCRRILEGLGGQAGSASGEAPAAVDLGELTREVLAALGSASAARVTVALEGAEAPLRLPRAALVQAIGALVRNALEAGPSPVSLRAGLAGARLSVTVEDRGHGMAPAILARAGEPFFTTKAPGQGLGLGLFLARTLAEQLGGELQIDSQPGRGTRAVLSVSASALPGRQP